MPSGCSCTYLNAGERRFATFWPGILSRVSSPALLLWTGPVFLQIRLWKSSGAFRKFDVLLTIDLRSPRFLRASRDFIPSHFFVILLSVCVPNISTIVNAFITFQKRGSYHWTTTFGGRCWRIIDLLTPTTSANGFQAVLAVSGAQR